MPTPTPGALQQLDLLAWTPPQPPPPKQPPPNAATRRANALNIPVSHRDVDALETSTATELFREDRSIRDVTSLGLIAVRLYHEDARVRRGARFDVKLYDLLGAFVRDDGYAVVSQRELAQRLGVDKKTLLRRLHALEAEGTIRVVRHAFGVRKSAAIALVPFARRLGELDKLRPARPEIAERLRVLAAESSAPAGQPAESSAPARAEIVPPLNGSSAPASAKVVPPLSSSSDQLFSQLSTGRADAADPDRTGARIDPGAPAADGGRPAIDERIPGPEDEGRRRRRGWDLDDPAGRHGQPRHVSALLPAGWGERAWNGGNDERQAVCDA